MYAQEQALCELFAEVLGIPEIHPDDNFFDLGGHSLLASQLVGKIKERLGTKVTIRRIYEAPTPQALVKHLVGDPVDAVH